MTDLLDYGFGVNSSSNQCSDGMISSCSMDTSIIGQRCCLLYYVNVNQIGTYNMLATVKHPSGYTYNYTWSPYFDAGGVYWKAVDLGFGYMTGTYNIIQLGFV